MENKKAPSGAFLFAILKGQHENIEKRRGKDPLYYSFMDAEPQIVLCPSCRVASPIAANFCSNCGRNLRSVPLSTGVSRQIGLYLFAAFLGPLAIGYALKYIRQSDGKAKKIGVAMMTIIVLSILLTIWTAQSFFESLYAPLNSLNSLNSLGY